MQEINISHKNRIQLRDYLKRDPWLLLIKYRDVLLGLTIY